MAESRHLTPLDNRTTSAITFDPPTDIYDYKNEQRRKRERFPKFQVGSSTNGVAILTERELKGHRRLKYQEFRTKVLGFRFSSGADAIMFSCDSQNEPETLHLFPWMQLGSIVRFTTSIFSAIRLTVLAIVYLLHAISQQSD